jgi:WD40 repeat protein/tRNA A-37 threonylcarbamoyl transferase component Bud32
MNTRVMCDRCGAALAKDGLCPRCELALGLTDPLPNLDLSPETPDHLKRFGEYELLAELGHGGMGVVYRARQTKLNRVVALKLLLLGGFSSERSVRRFQREAQAAAALRHPNIVSVFDVGEAEGQPYLTMEYVEGQSLASLLRSGPLPARQAAEYGRAIAEAISVAHATGLVHRDLKPSNILIDLFDQPRITDFGLAKWFAQTAGPQTPVAEGDGASREVQPNGRDAASGDPDSELTISGQLLGSPNYLAPELAAGDLHRVGPAGDIYSIGALLYECLTGRPPFVTVSIQETLLRIRDTEPVGIRRLNTEVPRDLETICLKCLEKEPRRRYLSARELAEDLARFLRGEPVRARPLGSMAKTWRWSRRKPAVAGLVAALLVAMVLGLSGILWQWRRAEAGELTARERQYASDMNSVQQAWDAGNLKHANSVLSNYLPKRGEPDLRGFEWRYLSALCRDRSEPLFTNLGDGIGALGFAPGGNVLVAAVGNSLKLLDPGAKRELATLREPEQDFIASLAFFPITTNLIVTGGERGIIRIWDLQKKEGTPFATTQPGISCVAVSPDEKHLAAVADHTVSVWFRDPPEPARLLWSTKLSSPPRSVAFDPSGLALISGGGGGNGNAVVWEVETGHSLTPFRELHKGWMEQIRFSPDGHTMATCADDDKLILWEYQSRQPKSARLRHAGHGMAFSPDGSLIASVGYDTIVHVWDARSAQPVTILRELAPVDKLAFTPDGKGIVTSGWDQSLRIWSPLEQPDKNLLKQHKAWVHSVALSPDGKTLVSVDAQDFSVVWDVGLRQPVCTLSGGKSYGAGALFSPDGKLLVTSSYGGKVMLWDAETLDPLGTLTNAFGTASLAFSPDGKILATASGFLLDGAKTNTLFFWDVATRQRINRFPEAAFEATEVAFSHDGQRLAVAHFDGSINLWDWTSGKRMSDFPRLSNEVAALEFSPDDSLLAAGAIEDEHVMVYQIDHPQVCHVLEGHNGGVRGLAFAPDGRTLVTAGNDGLIRLWSLTIFQSVLTLKEHTGAVTGIAFSRTGDVMASCDAEGDVRLWPTQPSEQR